jgi:hypothetical protein
MVQMLGMAATAIAPVSAIPQEFDIDGTAPDAGPHTSHGAVVASGMQYVADKAGREDAGANLQPPIHPQMQCLRG